MVGGISILVLGTFGELPGGTLRFGVLSLVILFVSGAVLFRLSEKANATKGGLA